jgi:hypothetical protein
VKKDHFNSDVPYPVPFYREGVDLYYSNLYKELYKLGRQKNISPSVLLDSVLDIKDFSSQMEMQKKSSRLDSQKFA